MRCCGVFRTHTLCEDCDLCDQKQITANIAALRVLYHVWYGRGAVSTWCKDAWASITPEMVKTCFKICGLTLAVDGSEDHAWCMHNFGEG